MWCVAMKIKFVEILNFRKLRACHLAFSEKETVLVGPNNSGKTSAMDALILFLKKSRQKDFATTDFTLSNWTRINEIGRGWVDVPDDVDNLDIQQWRDVLISIDIWLEVDDSEVHHVAHLIPTLDWAGGDIGVRLCFEPNNITELYGDFKQEFDSVQEICASGKSEGKEALTLWPVSLQDYLDRHLLKYFGVQAYLLDPTKFVDPNDGEAKPQKLPDNSFPLDRERDPFNGLFKIDVINAQRGFYDAKTSDGPSSSSSGSKLTNQLRGYFDKHLNPSERPTQNDVEALRAIQSSSKLFDAKLESSFRPAISELETLGYPGFSDPKITLKSRINPIDGLDHDSAVQFNIGNDSLNGTPLGLPEKYNGLGYQNLISMVFKLIRFRDEWMQKGKAAKTLISDDYIIEPLHIVLIEEPEAHLHAQVQQVFIRKAYEVLRNDDELKLNSKFSTQMIVSSHSSYIAHEIDFQDLRYFRKKPAENATDVPCATVVNLSTTFGSEDDSNRFASRYLKTTHCDLFFADAVILVEGPTERMLVPQFIRTNFPDLTSRYITILEIGGSHSHSLKPLIKDLGLITLIITDIDSVEGKKKIIPQRGKSYSTNNATLKTWIPKKTDLDELLTLNSCSKISENSKVRVAYQYPFEIDFKELKGEVIPYTFEDALVFRNCSFFNNLQESKGLMKKMYQATLKTTILGASEFMFKALDKGKKAEMALDLLYLDETDDIQPPQYIFEGLEWLEEKLVNADKDFLAIVENKKNE